METFIQFLKSTPASCWKTLNTTGFTGDNLEKFVMKFPRKIIAAVLLGGVLTSTGAFAQAGGGGLLDVCADPNQGDFQFVGGQCNPANINNNVDVTNATDQMMSNDTLFLGIPSVHNANGADTSVAFLGIGGSWVSGDTRDERKQDKANRAYEVGIRTNIEIGNKTGAFLYAKEYVDMNVGVFKTTDMYQDMREFNEEEHRTAAASQVAITEDVLTGIETRNNLKDEDRAYVARVAEDALNAYFSNPYADFEELERIMEYATTRYPPGVRPAPGFDYLGQPNAINFNNDDAWALHMALQRAANQ